MKKNYSHITTLIILFSIATVILQFTAYYFINSFLLTLGISALLCLLGTRILLQLTNNYGSCFSYSLLNVLLCSIILLLSYLGNTQNLFLFHEKLYLFLLINWLVPHLFAVFRNITDTSDRISGFKVFFRNSSIVFGVFYLITFIQFLFIRNTEFLILDTDLSKVNLVPFYTLATLIEDYISDKGSLSLIRTYFIQGLIPFIPYGFYIILMLRYQKRGIRFMALFLFPVIIEILQRILLLGKADIEEVLLGLLGGFVGAILYHGVNALYSHAKDRDFLTEPMHFTYYKYPYRY